MNDENNIKKGIDYVVKFKNALPQDVRGFIDPVFKQQLKKAGKTKGSIIQNYIDDSFR